MWDFLFVHSPNAPSNYSIPRTLTQLISGRKCVLHKSTVSLFYISPYPPFHSFSPFPYFPPFSPLLFCTFCPSVSPNLFSLAKKCQSIKKWKCAWVVFPVYQAKTKVEILMMYMLCCWAKIVYYICLILYHAFDVDIDFNTVVLIHNNGTFAGASTNSIVVEYLFGFSFVVGCVCSIAMILVYLYYIKFHLSCICESSWRRCDKRCNRRFVYAELWISLLELLFKDDIQSGLLFWVCVSGSVSTRPGWQPIALSVCSVVAHLKLGICFATKLCGCGEGEEEHNGSCAKLVACFIGMIGSVLFLIFTIAYLVYALAIAPHEVSYEYAYNFE